ncbi:MAG: ankyrin repeat domain-containing protein [Acidobacteriota bacterium]|nr:ankyrin repeat domain-containing protein [Acidobacteriota bacterium]
MADTIRRPYPMRRLSDQPDLELLKKEGEELLGQYDAGDPAVIATVRQLEHSRDSGVFALADARQVLARAYGYENWSKLEAFVDGVNVAKLVEGVKNGGIAQVRTLLNARPELVGMDVSASNEHRALHYAVLRRDAGMVRLLMEAGSDARKGIYPHRDATSALTIAKDREYEEIVAVIEEEERLRREEMSCPNATVSPIQEQINAAISQGDKVTATRLLNADRSLIQACDGEGATPLHIAAQESDEELVQWLLDRSANVWKQDIHGLTALDRAARAVDPRNVSAKQFRATARHLLERGAELTVRAAIALADSERVRDLIHADPNLLGQIDWRDGGLLSLAVKHGHLEIAKLLLELGADVDERVTLHELEQPTLSWGTPLWYAALAGNGGMAELLLDHGADPNANVYASGWPLRNAWKHEDDSVKQLLLERGAQPQPYMLAEAHDLAGAKRLLETAPSEQLANELAWSAADHGCPEILQLALPQIDRSLDDSGWHWTLIQPIRGASDNPNDNVGHFACMAVLLQHGIDPNVSRFGQTALHFAAAYQGSVSDADRARFASMLLDGGARLDSRDDLLMSTPLAWACRWGRKQLAELLIARGAVVDELDAEPWATPLAWATKMKQDSVARLLLDHSR